MYLYIPHGLFQSPGGFHMIETFLEIANLPFLRKPFSEQTIPDKTVTKLLWPLTFGFTTRNILYYDFYFYLKSSVTLETS